jgi:hypothetical protein
MEYTSVAAISHKVQPITKSLFTDTSLRFGGQQDYLVIASGNQHISALRYLFALVKTYSGR